MARHPAAPTPDLVEFRRHVPNGVRVIPDLPTHDTTAFNKYMYVQLIDLAHDIHVKFPPNVGGPPKISAQLHKRCFECGRDDRRAFHMLSPPLPIIGLE